MIHSAVSLITHHLNQYLKTVYNVTENLAVISNITEPGGTAEVLVNNKIAVFLVNVKKETGPDSRSLLPRTIENPVFQPPLHLNLFLMFTANFQGQNYPEALKFLSQTIGFFQRTPVFDHEVAPDMDPRIEKLILDIENLDYGNLSNLWSILGGKYVPSILYRVRMLTMDKGDIMEQRPAITGIQTDVEI